MITGASISGLGVYLPRKVRTNEWWSAEERAQFCVEKNDVLAATGRFDVEEAFAGIQRRHIANDDETSAFMASEAAKRALTDAGIKPTDIDAVLHASLLPDNLFPNDHIELVRSLGLKRSVLPTVVDAGSASFTAQLVCGRALISSGQARHVLLVQSNIVSKMVSKRSPSSIGAGDAATACVLSQCEPNRGCLDYASLVEPELSECVRYGPSDLSIPWYRGDLHSEPLYLRSMSSGASRKVGEDPTKLLVEAVRLVLDRIGRASEEIDLFVSVQCAPWFVSRCCRALSIDPDRSVSTYYDIGHVFSSGPVVNLLKARKEGLCQAGRLAIIASQGPGLQACAIAYCF